MTDERRLRYFAVFQATFLLLFTVLVAIPETRRFHLSMPGDAGLYQAPIQEFIVRGSASQPSSWATTRLLEHP